MVVGFRLIGPFFKYIASSGMIIDQCFGQMLLRWKKKWYANAVGERGLNKVKRNKEGVGGECTKKDMG